MKVTGLDLSLTNSGWATVTGWTEPAPLPVLADGSTPIQPPVRATRVDFGHLGSKPSGDTVHARSRRLRRLAGDLYTRTAGSDLVLVEAPTYGAKVTGSAHDRAGLWWLLCARLTGAGIPVAEVHNTAIKMYATGKGNADKDAVLVSAVRTFPALQVQTNDEADALWLAALAARHLGHPIETWPVLPKDRARALERIQWPTEGK